MNDNGLRRPDPGAMEDGCRNALTPTTYSHSSDITLQGSHQTANATSQGQSAEWTNEKHNAYLNFLEESFVQQFCQLRSSTGLHEWCSQEDMSGPCSSQALSGNTHHSSNWDGSRQKIKFKVNETLFDDATGSSEQHLDHHLWHLSSDDGTAEVSDQNFVDEDWGNKSSPGSTAKRLKRAGVDALTIDQAPLLGRLHSPNVTAVSHASSGREEYVHQELLSEYPRSFASQRSNMHYFLRGS